ncbi:hypothetical protein BH10PSE6_BH10PSE6_35550 [soil metagenome]
MLLGAFAAASLILPPAQATAQTATRLYIMDCGHKAANDQARWSPGVNAGKPIELSDNCYLIQHGSQLLLSDTGYPDSVADKPLTSAVGTATRARRHQSLLVRLPRTGYVVLSGDLAHFEDNWDNDRGPSMNTSADQTHASRAKVVKVLDEKKAQLWINHDKPTSIGQKHSPDFYD